ncbi:MAG TPA: hypothetical protein VGB98_10345 [Pyrinomonadaceae bacterium]|jgi:hypothetical protein
MLREGLHRLHISGRSSAKFLFALTLVCALSACTTNEAELQKKYNEGFEAGKQEGTQEGYQQGYDDGLNKRPKKIGGPPQNPHVNTIVYACAALSIVVFLYWLLFIYGYYTDPRELLKQSANDEFYEGILFKLLISLAAISLALLLLPANYIVRLNVYLNDQAASQYAIIFCGIVLSFITVFVITKTTANRRPSTRLVFQWLWAIIFPVIIYEMVGSFLVVQGWEFEHANYNLLLQAGMLIGPLTFLSIQRLIMRVYDFA